MQACAAYTCRPHPTEQHNTGVRSTVPRYGATTVSHEPGNAACTPDAVHLTRRAVCGATTVAGTSTILALRARAHR